MSLERGLLGLDNDFNQVLTKAKIDTMLQIDKAGDRWKHVETIRETRPVTWATWS